MSELKKLSKSAKAKAQKALKDLSTDTKPVGRPTKYKPEFCQQLIDHMAGGLSFESFAAVIEVDRDTLYEWNNSQPDFSDATKRAKDKCQLYWEKLGRDHVLNESIEEENYEEGTKKKSSKSLNPAIWVFNMKNRFKWRDKQPEEVDTTVVNNNTLNLSEDDIDKKIQEKLKALKL